MQPVVASRERVFRKSSDFGQNGANFLENISPFTDASKGEEVIAAKFSHLSWSPGAGLPPACLPDLKKETKSERASWKSAWARRASASRSSGLSRGSWMLSAEPIIMSSSRAFSSLASISIRAMRGSSGRRAIVLPVCVSLLVLVDRAQFAQNGQTILYRSRGGRVEKRKVLYPSKL